MDREREAVAFIYVQRQPDDLLLLLLPLSTVTGINGREPGDNLLMQPGIFGDVNRSSVCVCEKSIPRILIH